MMQKQIPVQVIFKPTVKTPEEIYKHMQGSKYITKLYRT